jgi:hypothetical protein
VTPRRCDCGRFIKSKDAKRCQSCRPQGYKKMQSKIIEKRMATPRSRIVKYRDGGSEE